MCVCVCVAVFVCVSVLCEVSGWSLVPTQGCGLHIWRVGCWELRAGEDTHLPPSREMKGRGNKEEEET